MAPSESDHNDLVRAVEQDVAALTVAVEREQPELMPLDRSYPSLDRIETYYRDVLEGGGTTDLLDRQIASYVGGTLAASTGGRWEPPTKESNRRRPGIARLPHLRRGHFDPLHVVRTFKRTRFPGLLRDETERHDIPRRRSHLARLLASREAALARLQADLHDLLGRDPGALDGSPASMATIEEAFKRLAATDPSPELTRRMEDATVLYLGQLAHLKVGGNWTIREDPKDADLGQLQMDGWAPISVIRNVGPESRPNLLQTALEMAIRGRTRT